MHAQGSRATRRHLVQGVIAGLAGVSLNARGRINEHPNAAPATPEPPAQPNILLILTDDMRVTDLPYLPAVQALLVQQGATFTNFSATAPGCGPARASILRGQYPHSHGVRRGSSDYGGLERFRELGNEDSNIATWLHDAGYRTALVGKYLNGYNAAEGPLTIPPGWDDWYGVSKEGYSRFNIYEQGVDVRYSSREAQSKKNSKDVEEQHLTDVLAEKARQVIADVAPTGQPLFLHISPRAPHDPAEPASWHLDALPDVVLPNHASMNEADVSDKPNWVQILPLLTDQEMAETNAAFRARLQTLLSVDDLITGVIEELAQQGILNNTYIIFSSDNGFGLGEHRVVQEKGSPYEEAIMVPMVMRGPGIAPGSTLDLLASQVDLAPTFAAWGGAAVPDIVEGRSLAGVVTGEPTPEDWRTFQFIEHFRAIGDRMDRQPAFEALRTPEMVYVIYGTDEQELYTLTADPYQTENQAATADPALLDALRTRAQEMLECTGAICREIEQEPLPVWP